MLGAALRMPGAFNAAGRGARTARSAGASSRIKGDSAVIRGRVRQAILEVPAACSG